MACIKLYLATDNFLRIKMAEIKTCLIPEFFLVVSRGGCST